MSEKQHIHMDLRFNKFTEIYKGLAPWLREELAAAAELDGPNKSKVWVELAEKIKTEVEKMLPAGLEAEAETKAYLRAHLLSLAAAAVFITLHHAVAAHAEILLRQPGMKLAADGAKGDPV